MRMVKPSDPHSALIFTMVLIAAAECDMTDGELGTIGRLVRYLPIFKDFDHDRLTDVGRDCADLLRQEDGLEQALEIITETLPRRLHETAYALACDVAVADGSLAEEELNLLEMLRARLEIDRLTAAAIERATRARHALL
jgi:tellurite resistance protein